MEMKLIGYAGYKDEDSDVYLYQCNVCKSIIYSGINSPECGCSETRNKDICALISAISARENKVKSREQAARLDNALSHLNQALEEIRKGQLAIKQFDEVV